VTHSIRFYTLLIFETKTIQNHNR